MKNKFIKISVDTLGSETTIENIADNITREVVISSEYLSPKGFAR